MKPDAVVEGGALRGVRRRATLDDVGLSVTSIDERGVLAVNSSAGLLTETQASRARGAIQLSGDERSACIHLSGKHASHGRSARALFAGHRG